MEGQWQTWMLKEEEREQLNHSLSSQGWLTPLSSYRRGGRVGGGRREERRERQASIRLTIKDNIWKKAKEEAVVEPPTLIPQHRPKTWQRGEREQETPLSHKASLTGDPPFALGPCEDTAPYGGLVQRLWLTLDERTQVEHFCTASTEGTGQERAAS